MAHVECVEKSPRWPQPLESSLGRCYAIGQKRIKSLGQQGLYQGHRSRPQFPKLCWIPSYLLQTLRTPEPLRSSSSIPVYSVRGQTGATDIFQNPLYDNPGLAADRNADNSVLFLGRHCRISTMNKIAFHLWRLPPW